jgi:cell division protein ZapA (FtsZ GTPase activity inhibitor)
VGDGLKSHKVEIAGQRAVIRSDATEAQVQRLADGINRRVQRLRKGSPTAPPLAVLALVTMQLADELEELRSWVRHERRESAVELRKAAQALVEGARGAEEWLAATQSE